MTGAGLEGTGPVCQDDGRPAAAWLGAALAAWELSMLP